MNQDHVHLIESWLRMQSSHDMSRLAEVFTTDVTYEDLAMEKVASGYAGVTELFDSIYASMPDYNVTLVSAVADEDRGGAEFIIAATHVGDFPDAPGTGESFSLRAASAMRFSNGRVNHWSDYWSWATFRKQVGLE